MVFVAKPRRSIWIQGFQADEPTTEQRQKQAQALSQRIGVEVPVLPLPDVDRVPMRAPRITIPDALAEFTFTDNYERALHAKGDRLKEIRGIFENPPDAVAHPRTEEELERVLDWCSSDGYAAIPYGGGSSVVDG